jgi:hypothetical protein
MAQTREKIKGRKSNGSFAALPHSILHSEEYAALSAHAVKLLIDVFGQFNGGNNGDLSAPWSVMARRGWKSKRVFYRSLRELEEGGWLYRTRTGGRRICNLYAVTWLLINPSNKYDATPPKGVLNTWRK